MFIETIKKMLLLLVVTNQVAFVSRALEYASRNLQTWDFQSKWLGIENISDFVLFQQLIYLIKILHVMVQQHFKLHKNNMNDR